MDKDYYKILGLDKNSSEEEIKKSYRKLAIKWHPDKNPNNKEQAEKEFKLVSEAYAVLSDPKKKQIYDNFGLSGLEQQDFGRAGNFKSGIDPNVIFRSFFSSHDDLFSQSNIFGNNYHFNLNSNHRQKKDLIKILSVSLIDIYNGCIKKMKINRKKIVNNTISTESEILEIKINPGMKDGTRFTFYNKGDNYNGIGDNIIFELKQIDHNYYKRENNDLILKNPIKISLLKSLIGFKTDIKSITNENIEINLNDQCPIDNNYIHIIKGKGMYSFKHKLTGDLKIQFNIVFPKNLTHHQKELLEHCLPE